MSHSIAGPVIGGTSVELDALQDESGERWAALLQFDGELRTNLSSSSLVWGVWVKALPPPPDRQPILTLTPAGGGPLSPFAAASFLDAAACGKPFMMAPLWEGSTPVRFSAPEVSRLAFAIRAALPITSGSFSVRWVPALQDDHIPF